jgi:hypothetical protein
MSWYVEGVGGNRGVPPGELLGGAEARLEEEGGSWGRHGFPHGSEPTASDAHAWRGSTGRS